LNRLASLEQQQQRQKIILCNLLKGSVSLLCQPDLERGLQLRIKGIQENNILLRIISPLRGERRPQMGWKAKPLTNSSHEGKQFCPLEMSKEETRMRQRNGDQLSKLLHGLSLERNWTISMIPCHLGMCICLGGLQRMSSISLGLGHPPLV
jgi:hypothetical protein